MSVAMIILKTLVGLVFLGAGGQKLAAAKSQRQDFERFGYPLWFMYLTGVLELTGATGMFVGVFAPVWGALAGFLLAVVMAGAIATHIRVKDPAGKMVPPTVLLLLALGVSASYFFA